MMEVFDDDLSSEQRATFSCARSLPVFSICRALETAVQAMSYLSGLLSPLASPARAARPDDLEEILSTEQRNLRGRLQKGPHVVLGSLPGELGHLGLYSPGPCS